MEQKLKTLERKLNLINYYYPNRKNDCDYDKLLKEYRKTQFLLRLDNFIKQSNK